MTPLIIIFSSTHELPAVSSQTPKGFQIPVWETLI